MLVQSVRTIRDALSRPQVPGSALERGPEKEQGPEGKVHVESFPHIDDFYQITLYDEDHTVGNVLQGCLYEQWVEAGGGKVVSYIGYHMPHPQERLILLKVKLAQAGDDVYARVAEGMATVIGLLEALMVEWVGFAGLAGQQIAAVEEQMARTAKSVLRS